MEAAVDRLGSMSPADIKQFDVKRLEFTLQFMTDILQRAPSAF